MWNDFVRFLNPCKIEVVLTTLLQDLQTKIIDTSKLHTSVSLPGKPGQGKTDIKPI